MSDAYEQAVDYLTAYPGCIKAAWDDPTTAKGGVLFLFASPTGLSMGTKCGCLTMIRPHVGGILKPYEWEAWTPELTQAIRADNRIPCTASDITVDSLPVFAGWQRRIDIALNRKPPKMRDDIPLPSGDYEFPEPVQPERPTHKPTH